MQLLIKLLLIYWQYKKQKEQGLTLLELIVVVFILGILATVFLPSLLSQVGKARESEAVVNIGALNRAQQVYFTEKSVFAGAGQINNLETPVSNTNYYTFTIADDGIQHAIGNNNANNGTKDYLGGIQFSTDIRSYQGIICRASNSLNGYVLTDTDITNAGVSASTNILSCNSTNAEEVR